MPSVGASWGDTLLLRNNSSRDHKRGYAVQWFTSLGYSFLDNIDIHFSYRSVSPTIRPTYGSDEFNTNGEVIGVGTLIGF